MVRNTIGDWQPRGQASPDIEPVLSQTRSDAQGRFSVVIPQTMFDGRPISSYRFDIPSM